MKTDLQLKQDVTDELNWDPAIDAAAIGVEVRQGVVTLSGHLRSYAEKVAAERVAQRVRGVRAVVVDLEVLIPGEFRDEEIAAAARNMLQWHVHVPSEQIHVTVEKGCVTLTGIVEWGYQRRLAERVVAQLRGVTAVTNQIGVKPGVAPADLHARITAALKRHAEREARHIEILVERDAVTLKGKVDSLLEREAAVGAAWSAPGVSRVIDDLHVG